LVALLGGGLGADGAEGASGADGKVEEVEVSVLVWFNGSNNLANINH
jgi:hypothetical protein